MIEWRYTSPLPGVFMTCTDIALQCVCQVAKDIQAGLVLCRVTLLRNSKQIGYKTPISNGIFPGGLGD